MGIMHMRTLPAGFIAPCLPTKTDKLPSGSDWLHEIKHDGFRIIARKTAAAALRAGASADSGISPGTKNFFAKTSLHVGSGLLLRDFLNDFRSFPLEMLGEREQKISIERASPPRGAGRYARHAVILLRVDRLRHLATGVLTFIPRHDRLGFVPAATHSVLP